MPIPSVSWKSLSIATKSRIGITAFVTLAIQGSIGDGEVGKTQLVNRLAGKSFEENPARTADFDVHHITIDSVGPGKQDVSARVYDFGGQPHLWSAHRFFLSSYHNLYFVVIDGTRQDKHRIDYWLRYIRHYVGKGTELGLAHPSAEGPRRAIPVLVVFTNSDRAQALSSEGRRAFSTISEAAAASLSEEFAAFADVQFVREYSSKTGTGLCEIVERLRGMIGRMDYIFQIRYANSLHLAKGFLEGDQEAREKLGLTPFEQSLSLDSLNIVFQKAQRRVDRTVDKGAYPMWLRILRNLGVLHWVGDVEDVDGPVAKTVYHPKWVRRLVYGVLRAEASIRGDGIANEETLCRLMCTACKRHRRRYRAGMQPCHWEVLQLMEACHLLFKTTERGKRRWLVLDWLNPTTGFVLPHPPMCVLQLDGFLPESLLLHYAGRRFSQLASSESFRCLSREHVVVGQRHAGNVQAAIKADWRSRRVLIWALGGSREQQRELVAQVKDGISAVAELEGLGCTEVPNPRAFVPGNELSPDAKEQKLAGLVMVTVAEANQILRLVNAYDKGIDGEIEFTEGGGNASGCRVYVQLKSGDSYLRRRARDSAEIFDVKKRKHLTYWTQQPCDVYLVVAGSEWFVRWMNVTRYLQRRTDKTSKQIVFDGEVLERDAVLGVRRECLAKMRKEGER